MKTSEGKLGRIFIIRLEDGDPMPASVEAFAAKKKIRHGLCVLVGGVKSGGKIVCGPDKESVLPIHPLFHTLSGIHEIAGVGTLAPDEEGKPVLHMHAALGRKGKTRMGCIRPGIETWKVGEVILLEISGSRATRKFDSKTGFHLLEP
jgi:uncharacterized protein